MAEPHSLLAACKLAAELAGVPWSRAQPIYRALQQSPEGEPLLPLSRGRAIQMAEPKYVARFLMGLALTDDPRQVGGLVARWAAFNKKPTPPDIEERQQRDVTPPDTLEGAISIALRDGWSGYHPDEREGTKTGLSSIEFEPDEDPPGARVVYWGGWGGFGQPFRYVEDPLVSCPSPRLTMLCRSSRVAGLLLHELSQRIVWGQ